MIKLLLTFLSFVSKVPGAELQKIYQSALSIVQKNDDPSDKTSGWEKLKNTVLVLVNNVPAKYADIAGAVAVIVTNIALIVTRLKKG